MKAFLSPKIASGCPPPIHLWPLSYGFIYLNDTVGAWDFSATWATLITSWATDRDGITLSSAIFTNGRNMTQASNRLLPSTHTLVFRHKGFTTNGNIFNVGGSSFSSYITVSSNTFTYTTTYRQGGSVIATNSATTYYDWAIVRTPSTALIYRNGVYIGQVTGLSTQYTLKDVNGYATTMNLDFIQLYDCALSEDEILYIYNNN